MSSSVEDWLRSLGFIHYTQAFLDNGYDELEICKEIGKEDLDAIGVRNFKDRTDILNAVEKLKQSGTAVYFVLEGNAAESELLPTQPERESYPPIQLKMMLRDKLEEDRIDLTSFPYSRPDGSEGTLDTLVTIYADKYYTYEEQVLTALRSLRQRQVENERAFDKSSHVPQVEPSPLATPERVGSTRHSSKYNSHGSQKKEDEEERGAISEDESHHRSFSSEDTTSPTRVGKIPADFLDVDSPAQRSKKNKKRRKVERNTKLSRSLDSLKELHVNVEPKPRDRQQSSFKSRPFGLKWLHGSKKKHHSISGSEIKKQALEKKLSNPSNPSTVKDYDMLASAIKMSEEDRMALMIMVKQGELTVEEAVEQLKRYEEDCRKSDNYIKPKGDDIDDDKSENKPKLKRHGFFGKSTKRKSNNRLSSEFVACEMTTMSEDDRINLMRSVKTGEMSVDQALKRFISYEEKHKKSDTDDAVPPKNSPKLPKSVSGFSRISIKRVSGVLSSSFRLPSTSANEPNAVFYTGEDGVNADGASADGSMSSGDEVLGTDSSPAPSPKRLLENIRDLNKSQQGSSSSVDSMEKGDDKPVPIPAQIQPPSFLSEMKMALGKQTRPEDKEDSEDAAHPDLKTIPVCDKYKKSLPPPPSPHSTNSLKKTPPGVPLRSGPAVAQPNRVAPPVPMRPPPKTAGDQRKTSDGGKTVQSEMNNLEVRSTKSELTEFKIDERQTEAMPGNKSLDAQTGLETGPFEQNNVETKDAVLRKPHRPPPLPPRPTSLHVQEESGSGSARSVETQTSPHSPLRNIVSANKAPSDVSSKKPPIPEAKPQLKPKPKPRARPRPKMVDTPDSNDEPYNQVPPPRPVRPSEKKLGEASDSDDDADAYNQVPPPRPVVPATQGKVTGMADKWDQPYHKVPPPRPVGQTKMTVSSDEHDEPYTEVPIPRPVGRGPPESTRTQGETSRNEMQTNLERDKSEPLATKRTEQKASRKEAGGDTIPVPAPRIKRVSHSLSEMVERKLHIESIDLTQEPYSDDAGCWGVPINLVDRYAEELRRSHQELAGIIDRIRARKLKEAGRQAVSCNVSELDFTIDPLGNLGSLSDWLTSLGLPMYLKSLTEVEYDDMDAMPYMEEKHFQFAGISDPRHMKRLLASVECMST